MAYTKQTWNNGDIITADKLNHIEDGVEKNLEPLIVNCSDDGNSNTVFDKTFAEVRDAYFSGRAVLCGGSGVNSAFYSVMGFYAGSDNAYQITVANGIYPVIYTTDSENGYPSHHWTD